VSYLSLFICNSAVRSRRLELLAVLSLRSCDWIHSHKP
jgi:hypothetical protein